MDIKFMCKECKHEIKEKSKFCPHCGNPLEMIETTYKISVEVIFTEKPKNCSTCRFSKAGYERNDYDGTSEFKGCCLLNPDIKFEKYHNDKYYGLYGRKIEECPIKI